MADGHELAPSHALAALILPQILQLQLAPPLSGQLTSVLIVSTSPKFNVISALSSSGSFFPAETPDEVRTAQWPTTCLVVNVHAHSVFFFVAAALPATQISGPQSKLREQVTWKKLSTDTEATGYTRIWRPKSSLGERPTSKSPVRKTVHKPSPDKAQALGKSGAKPKTRGTQVKDVAAGKQRGISNESEDARSLRAMLRGKRPAELQQDNGGMPKRSKPDSASLPASEQTDQLSSPL